MFLIRNMIYFQIQNIPVPSSPGPSCTDSPGLAVPLPCRAVSYLDVPRSAVSFLAVPWHNNASRLSYKAGRRQSISAAFAAGRRTSCLCCDGAHRCSDSNRSAGPTALRQRRRRGTAVAAATATGEGVAAGGQIHSCQDSGDSVATRLASHS